MHSHLIRQNQAPLDYLSEQKLVVWMDVSIAVGHQLDLKMISGKYRFLSTRPVRESLILQLINS
jgi:hypothetical protein